MMAFINREQSVENSLAAIERDEFGDTAPLKFLAHARTLAAEVRRLREGDCCAFCGPDAHVVAQDEDRHTHGEACCQYIPPGYEVREDADRGEYLSPIQTSGTEVMAGEWPDCHQRGCTGSCPFPGPGYVEVQYLDRGGRLVRIPAASEEAARTWERRLIAELCDMDVHAVDDQQISDLRRYLGEQDVRDFAVLSEHLGLPPDDERSDADIADAIAALRARERDLEQAWRSCRDDINYALEAFRGFGFPPVESDGIALTLRRFLARQSVRASGDADRLGFLADRVSDLAPRLRKIAAELGDSWPTTQDETSTTGDEDATTSDETGTSSR